MLDVINSRGWCYVIDGMESYDSRLKYPDLRYAEFSTCMREEPFLATTRWALNESRKFCKLTTSLAKLLDYVEGIKQIELLKSQRQFHWRSR